MPSNLPPVPHRTPIFDEGGYLNQIWSDFFQKLFLRTGGTTASTNDELYTVTSDRFADGSITPSKLAASVAGNGLSGGDGVALAVEVDGSTIEISGDQLKVKDSGITTAKINDGAVSFVKQLSSDWTNSKATSGYAKLPSGIYIQWGVTSSLSTATTTSISLPTSFPTACAQVVVTPQGNSGSSTTATGHYGTGNYSVSAFDLYNRTSISLTFNFLAVGY